jgi:hypothetical protein
MLVVAVACDGHDLGTYLSALLRDVVLADVLSRNEGGHGGDDSELFEEHCGGILEYGIRTSC